MNPTTETHSPLDIPLKRWFPATLETLLVVLLFLAAVVSRFYDLGARTMSHDEINHVVPSYSLYSGNGYAYDPMSHGPLQFNMIAFSYALFGDNDFTSRIPAATLSVLTILLTVFLFRRYLGRTGALVAGFLLLISPLMLFYGRYARNEAYIIVWSLLTLYTILRYLEKREAWVLVLFTVANAIHFTDKVTSYMLAGEQFLFLTAYLVDRLARREWQDDSKRKHFLLGLSGAILLGAVTAFVYLSLKPIDTRGLKIALVGMGLASVGVLVWAVVEGVRGLGWEGLRAERSMDLLMLLGTLVLPLTGAIPLGILNTILVALKKSSFEILDYSTAGMIRVGITVLILGGISAALGIWWFGRRWWLHAAIFFIPIVLLYSTFMTNPQGVIGGFVGALSYWSVQQGVARGGQPWYYYIFLMIPVYEFLPALGTICTAVIAWSRKLWQSQPGAPFTPPVADWTAEKVPVAALLVYWSVASIALFTYAGEKMPWLTIHLDLPMVLASAWGIGWLIETIPWGKLAAWGRRNYARAVTLVFFGLLAVLTGRAAFRAAYINYNNAFEFLVYAHAAADPKILFNEIEEMSIRTTGTTDMMVAYDNDVRYPYWWYMRHYAKRDDFDVNPTRDLRNYLVIAVGDATESKLTPVVQDNYYQFNGQRLWWPSMDYWSLKWDAIQGERNNDLAQTAADSTKLLPPMNVFEYLKYAWKHIQPFFTDKKVFYAVWQIWFNRDYTAWGELKSNPMAYTLTNWGVSNGLHYYIRKDIGSQLWPYGESAPAQTAPVDPYANITTPASPELVLGGPGTDPGLFAAPRGIALAKDGSLYVADSQNNRIQHLDPTGKVLQVWGVLGDVSKGNAPGGT
ncbi:MAG TPA: glycosyltransferase family 39 protein, partial [Anaerolineales bacterium]|nr:glycosyltransferase family 39 protein [Anaerolineales bacterium]